MKCLECGDLVIKNINIHNIFKTNYFKICEKCFSNSLFIQLMEVIPLNHSLLKLNILFDNFINPLSLINFEKPYYIYYLKYIKEHTIIYSDYFTLYHYKILNSINMGDIYYIALKKTEGEDYENRSYW